MNQTIHHLLEVQEKFNQNRISAEQLREHHYAVLWANGYDAPDFYSDNFTFDISKAEITYFQDGKGKTISFKSLELELLNTYQSFQVVLLEKLNRLRVSSADQSTFEEAEKLLEKVNNRIDHLQSKR